MKRKLRPLKEAAVYLNVTVHALRKWLRLRRIPFHRIGTLIKLDEADLDEFIESSRIPSRAEEHR